jgi:preprotein translocase subunit SecF
MNIIGKKYWFFLVSLIIIVPGIIALFSWGLNLSIEFTGGSKIGFTLPEKVSAEKQSLIKSVFKTENVRIFSTEVSGKTISFKTQLIEQAKNNQLLQNLSSKIKGIKEEDFEAIGPTIGSETTANAVKAIIIASLLIVIYISIAFRKVPKPASSFKFGVCAVVALLHDVLVIVGIFAIFGHLFGVEIDSLFVTAVLTIIGFSVHDTIVVFDRIRENLKRMMGTPFAKIVNESILQTLDRSLNTSLTVILVLLALLLFGGESIRWFVIALLIGIISGTYSSIFNAAPLLVVWEEWTEKRLKTKKQ